MSITFLQSNSTGDNLTTYTFAGENLGVAVAGRHIIVVAAGEAGSTPNITDISVGGVSATLVRSIGNGTALVGIAIGIAAVPTGTTGNVVVTFSLGQGRCGIALWRATNLASATPHDDEIDSTVAQDTTLTIDVPANGFVIAASVNNASTTETWSGIDENFGVALEAAARLSGGFKEYPNGVIGQTVDCDFAAGSAIGVAASWRITRPLGFFLFFSKLRDKWEERNGIMRPKGYGKLATAGLQI